MTTVSSAYQNLASDCPGWPTEFVSHYRANGCWEGISFGRLLRDRAQQHPEKTALVCGQRRWSYRKLDARADQLAAGFARVGIATGDVVVLQLPNVAEFMVVCFALFRIGALPVMALAAHRRSEIEYFCRFTQAKAYIIADRHGGFDYRQLAREVSDTVTTMEQVIVLGDAQEFTALNDLYYKPTYLPDIPSTRVAFFQLSGGTTGVPKLIPRTHDDYICSLRCSVKACQLSPQSVYLCVLPAAHNFPLSSPGTFGTLYAGGTIVMTNSPAPHDVFPLIAREQITITALVPPLALLWLDSAARDNSLRDVTLTSLQVLQVGGARLSAEAAKRVGPELGCTLQQVFGMAEGLVNYTRLTDDDDTIINTQGHPCSDFDEVKVVDNNGEEVAPGQPGHLLTRGPYTIRGYFRAPEHNARSFTADGFYRTGDVVSLTAQGDIVVFGRDKDQINRGGEKIAAEEVENHLLAHPELHDAAVVSIPDPYLGERACAFVIVRSKKPSVTTIKRFLASRGLAGYKIPDRIEFVDAFPKTAIGKVNKKSLRLQVS